VAVFGGADGERTYGAVHFYDPERGEWSAPAGGGRGPRAREMHVMEAIGGEIYVSGGRHTETGEVLDDLWIYTVAEDSWREAAAPGEARCCAASCALNGRLLIFGGFNGVDSIYDTLLAYSPSSKSWTAVDIDGAPSGRFGCAGAAMGEKMVVFGGSQPGGEVADVHEIGVYDDN